MATTLPTPAAEPAPPRPGPADRGGAAVPDIGWWQRDLRTGRSTWSPEVYALLGLDPALAPSFERFLARVHPDDRAGVALHDRRATLHGEPYELPLRVCRPDGLRHMRAAARRIEVGGGLLLVGTLVDDTDQIRAQESLRESQSLLARSQAVAHIGSFQLDLRTRGVVWSDETYRIFGVEPGAFVPTLDTVRDRMLLEDRAHADRAFADAVATGEPFAARYRIVRPDGCVRYVDVRADVQHEGTEPVLVYGTVHDVTEQQEHLDGIVAREQLLRSVLDSIGARAAVLDGEGRVVAVNRAWSTAAVERGSPANAGVGEDYHAALLHVSDTDAGDVGRAAAGVRAVLDGARTRFEMDYACRRAGDERWFELVVEALDLPCGGAVVSHWEITDRKRAEHALLHDALHDRLTGLPNRALLADRIEHAIERSRRDGRHVAVLFLDLDRFKLVNDTLGHAAGDELIRLVAQRLQDTVRSGDTVARFGGDEFVVVCERLGDPGEVDLLAGRLLEAFAYPFPLDGREIVVVPSVGVAVRSPGTDETADVLLRNADIAMYRAKEEGGRRYVFYDDRLRERAVQRLEVEQDLRRAITAEEFALVYQPQYDLASGALIGAEALLRWPRDGRPIRPDEFVPIAEETGLIVQIGAMVLMRACVQLAAWDGAGLYLPSLCVNVSARQLGEPGLVAMIDDVIARAGLAPGRICLEITETAVVEDPARALVVLRDLAKVGVQIALDDFGTGHTSLRHLSEYPLSWLKIDRVFVEALDRDDPAAAAVVAGIVAMSGPLGLDVLAEGVETPEQVDALKRAGCRYGQGYLLGRPLTPGAFTDLLRARGFGPDAGPVGAAG
ncbi:MAG: hypothetical protein KatS3mg009_2629 [Acidimicrobiia bacterium]|nr:MAG: hypothetical protein KatS3mg009_2629 [Acidimicrobiia bacterium]